MPKLLLKLLRDLGATKWQFAAVTLIVLLGVALFGASFVSYQNLRRSYDLSYRVLAMADLWVYFRQAPERLVEEAESLPGVKAASGRIVGDAGFRLEDNDDERIVARVVSLPLADRPSVNDVVIEEGSYFSNGATAEVLLEKRFAEFNGLKPGDRIYLSGKGEWTAFTVAGLAVSPEYIWVAKNAQEFMPSPKYFGVVFLPLPQAQQLFSMGGRLNEIVLTVEPGTDVSELAANLEGEYARNGVLKVAKRDDQLSTRMLEDRLNAFGKLAFFFPGLFLSMAAVMIYVLMNRVVQSQRPQIGLMTAIGYSHFQVVLHYVGFALAIGILGSLLGSLLGYYLAGLTTGFYVTMLNIPMMDTSPRWGAMAIGFLVGVSFCTLGGIVPAWTTVRLRPALSMRSVSPTVGRRTTIEALLPFVSRLSYTWKVPLRNMFRSQRRTMSTVLGVASAIALIMVSMSFFDAYQASMDLQLYKIRAYDAKVSFARPADSSLALTVARWEGVAQVEPVLEVPFRLRFGDKTATVSVMGLSEEGVLYNLFDLKSAPEPVTGEGLLVPPSIKRQLGAEEGDVLELEGLLGSGDSYEMEIAGTVRHPLGGLAFISLPQLQQMVKAPDAVTGLLVGYEEAAPEDLEQRLGTLPNAAGVESVRDFRRLIDEMMKMFYGFLGVMLTFGTALGAAIVFNGVTISMLERRREIATMRTLGTSHGKVTLMTSIENLSVGFLGVVVGFPIGYLLSKAFLGLYDNDLFTLEAVIFPRTYVLAATGILLVLLLSQLPGLRYISRLDLAAATKEWSL